MRSLTPLEARVLGVLVEKQHTVPDTYPLSLNALTAGCNQKNNRDPVMNLRESEVQAAVDSLRMRSLVIESSGSRVMRYSHNIGRVLKVPDQAVALLAVLFLRGPQTVGELRINSERLHRFADLSSVEAFLEELATRPAEKGGALVLKLPRQPGEREQRWVHLLCGPVEAAQAAAASAQPVQTIQTIPAMQTHQAHGQHDAQHLAETVHQLQQELQGLKAEIAELRNAIQALSDSGRQTE